MNWLRQWMDHPAEPWQFWYPQSGVRGGLMAFPFMLFLGFLVFLLLK